MSRTAKGKKGGKKAAKVTSATTKGAPSSAPAAKKDPQVLPSKEAGIFKQILKYYETKQYKKGLKAADQILKNHPLHGETLAMKGLTMNCMNRKEEARALVKKGVTLNIKSHVCWHVYGLLYRSDRMYDDAIKCYQNALRYEKDNQNIIKDLANLQVQRRMYDAFQETRRQLLLHKRNNRSNWVGYAVAAHLCCNYKKSINILDTFFKSQDEDKIVPYELSELYIYKNLVLEESGDHAGCLEHLRASKDKIIDQLYKRETEARLLSALGQKQDAEAHYRALLSINCENYDYHYGLVDALGLTEKKGEFSGLGKEKRAALAKLYGELAVEYPKVAAVQRIPLTFLEGNEFDKALEPYVQFRLRRGVPSLFRDLRSLYSDPAKGAAIAALFDRYTKALRSDLRFGPEDEPRAESPSTLIWCLYYCAHQFDHLGKYNEAMSCVDEALLHTPTNIDLYVLKARVLKHAGDLQLAHHFMDEARKMDTADRYLNVKCVRYALRADKVQEAADVVALFLRDGDSLISLVDMQCSWYGLQCAYSYERSNELGLALKQFTTVTGHFRDMEEDQFDFHTYCLKKVTLRAYVNMLRMEDNIRGHRFYFRAAKGAVRGYMKLWEVQEAERAREAKEAAELEALPAEERKKLMKKQKREAAKKAKQEAAAAEEDEKSAKEGDKDKEEGDKEDKKKGKTDKDPLGEELLKTEKPLEEATKYLSDLLTHNGKSVDTHVLAVQLYIAKKKPLLALRSLNQLLKLDPANPVVHESKLFFLHYIETNKASFDPAVLSVISLEGFSKEGETPASLNAAFVSQHGTDSLAHACAGARCAALYGAVTPAAFGFTKTIPIDEETPKACSEVLSLLLQHNLNDLATAWRAKCAARHPLTPAFMASDEARQAHYTKGCLDEPI